MKKSRCFKLAQMAVLVDSSLLPETKLDVLRVLMGEEHMAEVLERCEAENKAKESEGVPY